MSETKTVGRFKWADTPPPIHDRKKKDKKPSEFDVIVSKLKDNRNNRGRWARVKRDCHYTIITRANSYVKSNGLTDIKFTTRKNDNGKWDLWATWVKPVEATPETPETPAPVNGSGPAAWTPPVSSS